MITSEESQREPRFTPLPHHELQMVASFVNWAKLDASFQSKEFKLEQQPVLCDFDIVRHESAPARFYVSLLLEMENSRKAEGVLTFSIASLTEFEFRPQAIATLLPDDEKIRWHLFSMATATALSMTRGHLAMYLAPTAYRDYYLPMLNVQELVDKRYKPSDLPAVPSTAPSEKPSRKPYTRKPRE